MALGKRLINTGGVAACNTDSTDPFGDSSGVALYSLDFDASTAPDGTDYSGSPTDVDFGVEGKINYGARFNGSAYVTYNSFLSTTTDNSSASFSIWVKFNSFSSIQAISSGLSGQSPPFNLYVYHSGGTSTFAIERGFGGTIHYSSTYNTEIQASTSVNTWYHIVYTYTASTKAIEVFLNGNSIGTDTLNASASGTISSTQLLGGRNGGGSIDANLDQVRLFSKALNQTEVDTLFAEEACVYTATTTDNDYPTTNLAYYKLDNSAEDEKGSYDGTESNIEYRFGRFGQAAVFNGSSRIGTGITSFTNNLAISMWLNPSSLHSNGNWVFGNWNGTSQDFYIYVKSNGQLDLNFDGNDGSGTSFGSAGDISIGNWNHFVVSMSNGNFTVYLNSVLLGSGTTTNTTFSNGQDFEIGNMPKSSSVPSWNGLIDQVRIYNAALTSSQVTDLYNEKPEVDTSNFKTVLYDGNGSSQYISNVGFQPDLVWVKNRGVATSNNLFDSIRGNKRLVSNATNAQVNLIPYEPFGLPSFEENGFYIGDNYNGDYGLNGNPSGTYGSSSGYVSWAWKAGGDDVLNEQGSTDSQVSANTAAGFSIVKYTGAGDVNVGHGLLAPPNLIISKITNVGGSWVVYNSISGTGKYLVLNDTASIATASEVFSAVTDTTFTHNWSGNSYSYIAYCFHSVAGYSKIGTYTGNGTYDNKIFTTNDGTSTGSGGFEPSFVMIKNTETSGTGWLIMDKARDPINTAVRTLRPNSLAAEDASTSYFLLDWESDGFRLKYGLSNETEFNQTNKKYLFMAFK